MGFGVMGGNGHSVALSVPPPGAVCPLPPVSAWGCLCHDSFRSLSHRHFSLCSVGSGDASIVGAGVGGTATWGRPQPPFLGGGPSAVLCPQAP